MKLLSQMKTPFSYSNLRSVRLCSHSGFDPSHFIDLKDAEQSCKVSLQRLKTVTEGQPSLQYSSIRPLW